MKKLIALMIAIGFAWMMPAPEATSKAAQIASFENTQNARMIRNGAKYCHDTNRGWFEKRSMEPTYCNDYRKFRDQWDRVLDYGDMNETSN